MGLTASAAESAAESAPKASATNHYTESRVPVTVKSSIRIITVGIVAVRVVVRIVVAAIIGRRRRNGALHWLNVRAVTLLVADRLERVSRAVRRDGGRLYSAERQHRFRMDLGSVRPRGQHANSARGGAGNCADACTKAPARSGSD